MRFKVLMVFLMGLFISSSLQAQCNDPPEIHVFECTYQTGVGGEKCYWLDANVIDDNLGGGACTLEWRSECSPEWAPLNLDEEGLIHNGFWRGAYIWVDGFTDTITLRATDPEAEEGTKVVDLDI